jgi:hypothetical protein
MHSLGSREFTFWWLIALTTAIAANTRAAQTYTWVGGTSTAWQTASNWSPNGVPGVDDTAIINSGSPQLPGDGVVLPHIQLASGVLSGVGTVSSSMIWSAGRIDGIVTIASGASLSISGASSNHELANGGTVNNNGTVTWSGGYIWRQAADASATTCSFNNLAGGVFEMTGNNYAYVNGGRTWIFNNAGTVRKTAGTATSQITPTSFNNSGVVEAVSGTLEIGGPNSLSGGSFSASTGAVVIWNSGGISNGASFTGEGEKRMSAGSLNGTITSTNLVITGSVGGTATVSGTAVLRGGTLTGNLEMTGALNWQSGQIHGTLSIAATGALGISGNSTNHELANGGTVNNNGTVTWSGGYIWRQATDASATTCSFNNLAGGVFEMTGNNYAYVNGGRTWIFNNAGTVRKTAGTATSQITPTSFNNSGVVEAVSGTLEIGGPNSLSSGSFSASTGAVVIWNSGGITDGASFTGQGEKRVIAGSLNGTISATNLVITGSVGGTASVSGTAVLRGGTLTGNLEMTGALDWQSGSVHGTLSIENGGALAINTGANHELANGGTVNNQGSVTWNNGFIFRTATDTSPTSCSFNNLAGGIFQITGNLQAYVNSKPWSFNNAGTVLKTAGTGTCQILPTAFNSSGLVEVQAGTLQVGGSGSASSGSFTAGVGAILSWTSGGITNGASFSGAGENRVSGGTLDGTVSSTNLVISGPVGGISTVSGAAILRGGTVDGTMEITGALDWQSGSVHGTLSIANGGTLAISGTGASHELAEGGTVNNSGTVTWNNGYIFRTATDVSATSCSINNLAGGVFNITTNTQAYVNSKPWSFNNAGTLRKTAGTGTCDIQPTAFNSTGIVEVQAGTLLLGGPNSASSGSFIAASGAALRRCK